MNTPPKGPEFDKFDSQARQLHADALAHVSPRTLAKLRGARHAAAQAKPARGHGLRWLLAGAAPAAFAIALVAPSLKDRAPAVSAPQAAVATRAAPSGVDYADALNENPDLYVWLESDGQKLAME
jgi:hypothetical protein